MRKIVLLLGLCLLLVPFPSLAQEATITLPTPEVVKLTAADGLTLVGDFYLVPEAEGERPTVLLLHMLRSNRTSWLSFVPALIKSGYHVLAVDQRGHGQTGGDRDWAAAVEDANAWMNWLREQPSVKDDSISVIGASMGTVVALMSCANDEACVTAIALSPVDFDLPIEEAVAEGLAERSALLISGQRDRGSADAVRTLTQAATGELGIYLFSGAAHGTDMLSPRNSIAAPVSHMILDWLDNHTPAESS
jgi:pimeloyl-ACP methyl ester carboxylesterase